MSAQRLPSRPDDAEPGALDRRAFLGRFAALGLGASAFLAACGGERTDTGTAGETAAGGEHPVVPAAECEGYDELTEQQLQVRQSLQYVDESAREGQYCGNCRFQQAYAADGDCLGCQLFAGPVSPGGWCSSWTAQAT